MKRYIVFSYAVYYPTGGMEDFIGDFSRLDDAKIVLNRECGKDTRYIRGHIYDTSVRKIIFEFTSQGLEKIIP